MGTFPGRQRQRGVGMIEVLIAVLITAIGIIGIGLMMLTTLRDSGSAMMRSRAVQFTADLAERIRANPGARDLYVYPSAQTLSDKGCYPGTAAAAVCSAEDLAITDLWEWEQRISDASTGLPGVAAQVTIDTTATPFLYNITLSWEGARDRDSGELDVETFSMQMEL